MQEKLTADLKSEFVRMFNEKGIGYKLEGDWITARNLSACLDTRLAFNMLSHKFDLFYPIAELKSSGVSFVYVGQEQPVDKPDFRAFLNKVIDEAISRKPNFVLNSLRAPSAVSSSKPSTNNSKENK